MCIALARLTAPIIYCKTPTINFMRSIFSKAFAIISLPFRIALLLPFVVLAFFFDSVERYKQHADKKKKWMQVLEADKKLRQKRYRQV